MTYIRKGLYRLSRPCNTSMGEGKTYINTALFHDLRLGGPTTLVHFVLHFFSFLFIFPRRVFSFICRSIVLLEMYVCVSNPYVISHILMALLFIFVYYILWSWLYNFYRFYWFYFMFLRKRNLEIKMVVHPTRPLRYSNIKIFEYSPFLWICILVRISTLITNRTILLLLLSLLLILWILKTDDNHSGQWKTKWMNEFMNELTN